tara:strand:+ start:447 stop:2708 length:2262 start_codon:yes stop_codon:yes gene_type:complete
MKNNFFKNIKIKIFYFILITILNFNNAYSEILKEILIKGNERLSIETIIMFSGLDLNTEIDNNKLNLSIKNLYKTNYFKNIKMTLNNNILEIEIVENPIIQTIKIEGIKNKEILESLENITKKDEKYPFLINRVNDQKNLLANIVRSNGFYFAKIETKVIENINNSVDIVYKFDLGNKAIIKKINFKGNKIFKDAKLRNVIKSEEGKFWKFISRDKFLDQQRVMLDERLLLKFYKNKGYYNAKVKSSYAQTINNEFFELNFNIDSGEKFFFNNISFKIDENFSNENFTKLENIFEDLKGKKYSVNSLDKISKEIDLIALQKEFVFINATYNEKIVDKNKIDIQFIFEDLEKFYVEQINIFGNYLTEEKVIRNSLIVDEGDAFNQILFDKSIGDIKAKNIFKSVNSDIKNSTLDKQKKVIDITVEEKPTGEIFAGAGTGTSGSSISAGIKENNYLGKGITLNTNLTLSDDEIKGKFQVRNPNFRNSDKSLNTTIESTSSDFMTTSGFKTTRTGFGIGTGFEQYQDLFFNIDISTYYEKLETSDSASAIKKKQEGDYFENLVSYAFTLNKLDQNWQPTDGYKTSFAQVLPIYSEDLSIENTFKASKYHSVSDNLILSGKIFLKAVNSIDDDVRVSRRVYIPTSRLRGFESGKIGPKEGTTYIGGNYGSAINLNTTLPNILSGYENIDASLFLDAANLWHVDYNSSLDSNKIRSSTGLSVNWWTPIGPLSFSYAIPLSDQPSDKTESFRFRIGTSF